MRQGLIDSLKFPVAARDYRYDRIKNGEGWRGKKQGIWRRGTVGKKNQREKKMRIAIDGSASLIRTDVPAFVYVLFVCIYTPRTHTHIGAAVFDLSAQWQSSGHIARPLSPVCCTGAHYVVAACFP